METVKELVQFMQPNQRLDLKAVALTHVLGKKIKITCSHVRLLWATVTSRGLTLYLFTFIIPISRFNRQFRGQISHTFAGRHAYGHFWTDLR